MGHKYRLDDDFKDHIKRWRQSKTNQIAEEVAKVRTLGEGGILFAGAGAAAAIAVATLIVVATGIIAINYVQGTRKKRAKLALTMAIMDAIGAAFLQDTTGSKIWAFCYNVLSTYVRACDVMLAYMKIDMVAGGG